MRNRNLCSTLTFSRYSALRELGLLLAACGVIFSAAADDWPQWRGPHRDGISAETSWNQAWPEGGPKRLWDGNVGIGYSSFSVAQGRLFTMGNVQEKDQVYCFDARTGKPVWKYGYSCPAKDPNGYHGTRCTPTVDADRVYTVSRDGQFFCLQSDSGKKVWAKNFTTDFGGEVPTWGFSGSPLIEKDWVLTETGGPGASVVAFDKRTGQVVWKAGDEPAGYASLLPFDYQGERCFVQFGKDSIIGRRMQDGAELWRHSWKTSWGVNAATPIIDGDQVFISSGYGYGCALLQIKPNAVQEVWRNKNMRNHVSSCVRVDGALYGYDENELKCLDWKTGEVKWATKSYGKGSVIAAAHKLILYGQTGKLGLAEATPQAFRQICAFQALPGKDTWAPPVLANGIIYVRSLEKMAAFDVGSN